MSSPCWGGRRTDLSWVPVDLGALPGFACDVYRLIRRIPPGQTMTYGEVASALGAAGRAQAVGQALGRNPVPVIVPCHRVVAKDGLGGFSAAGGSRTKLALLELERGGQLPPGTADEPTLFD